MSFALPNRLSVESTPTLHVPLEEGIDDRRLGTLNTVALCATGASEILFGLHLL